MPFQNVQKWSRSPCCRNWPLLSVPIIRLDNYPLMSQRFKSLFYKLDRVQERDSGAIFYHTFGVISYFAEVSFATRHKMQFLILLPLVMSMKNCWHCNICSLQIDQKFLSLCQFCNYIYHDLKLSSVEGPKSRAAALTPVTKRQSRFAALPSDRSFARLFVRRSSCLRWQPQFCRIRRKKTIFVVSSMSESRSELVGSCGKWHQMLYEARLGRHKMGMLFCCKFTTMAVAVTNI